MSLSTLVIGFLLFSCSTANHSSSYNKLDVASSPPALNSLSKVTESQNDISENDAVITLVTNNLSQNTAEVQNQMELSISEQIPNQQASSWLTASSESPTGLVSTESVIANESEFLKNDLAEVKPLQAEQHNLKIIDRIKNRFKKTEVRVARIFSKILPDDEKHPKAAMALALGILSWFVFAIIFGPWSIALGAKVIKDSEKEPGRYTTKSIRKGKAGLAMGVLGLIGYIILLAILLSA